MDHHTLKVALIQMDVIDDEPLENLCRAVGLIRRSSRMGARLACLPELFTTGVDYHDLSRYAEDENGETVKVLRAVARDERLTLVAGSLPIRYGRKVYNSSLLIGPDGRIRLSYQKVHLFSPLREASHIAPGCKIPVCVSNGLKVGVMICYDIRFPELARLLALKGATLICVPAEFPEPRQEHWRVLLRARAIENQAYVLGVNRVGRDAKRSYFGGSMLIDPLGNVLAEAGGEEAVMVASIDTRAVQSARSRMPCLHDRRKDLYVLKEVA